MAKLAPYSVAPYSVAIVGHMLASALLMGAWGCSAENSGNLASEDGGDRGADAGAGALQPDGNGVFPFDPEDARFSDTPVPANGESSDAEHDNANSCFDDADNDDNGPKDCSDEACRPRGSCCVNNTDCCSALPESTLALNFTTCTSENIAACDPSLRLFGDANIDEKGVTFAADLAQSSGVALSELLDLRTLQRMVKFDFQRTCIDDSCSGRSGVSLVRGDPESPDTRPDIVVGLQAFAATEEVGLVIENTVVSTWPHDDGEQSWSLTVSPSGEVRVSGPNANFETFVAADMVAHVLVHGQGLDAAAITSLSVEARVCDSPRQWLEPTELVADDGLKVSNPSIAKNDLGETWVAFERDRHIHFGLLNGNVIEVKTTNETAISEDGEFATAVRRADPELVWIDDHWNLFFTGYAEDLSDERARVRGNATVGAIIRTRIDPQTFEHDGFQPVLAPYGAEQDNTIDWPWRDVLDFQMPTVTITENPLTPWIMVVRARLADRTTVLRAFKSGSGDNWQMVAAPVLEERTRRDGMSTALRFDAEEITHPSILVQNRAYHLYYEGRRGERSSVGLLVSDDLLGWRDMSEQDAIYEEGGAAFDRLGVRAADVLFDGTTVQMLYVGDDGSEQRPALTERAAPDLASM